MQSCSSSPGAVATEESAERNQQFPMLPCTICVESGVPFAKNSAFLNTLVARRTSEGAKFSPGRLNSPYRQRCWSFSRSNSISLGWQMNTQCRISMTTTHAPKLAVLCPTVPCNTFNLLLTRWDYWLKLCSVQETRFLRHIGGCTVHGCVGEALRRVANCRKP